MSKTEPRSRSLTLHAREVSQVRIHSATRLGLPGLAVQAQYGSSAPILRRLGFLETASIHTLQS